jgi:hypothetical protein
MVTGLASGSVTAKEARSARMVEQVPEVSVADVRRLIEKGVRPKFIDARDSAARADRGFTMAYLRGGIAAWLGAGLPV